MFSLFCTFLLASDIIKVQNKFHLAITGKTAAETEQIRQLERAVTGYFYYIEDLTERENVFTMQAFSESINAFLEFRRYDILRDNGKVLYKQALEKAYHEYEIFNKTQPIESDFDKVVKGLGKK